MPGLPLPPCPAVTAPRFYHAPCPLWTHTLRDLNPSPGAAWDGRWGGDCRQAGCQGVCPTVCAYETCVCVSKCASQLKEVSRKACHTCNTHTHLCCPISLMCYSPYLCPRVWPSLGLNNQAWAPPRAKEASAPQASLLCAWPLTGTERQQRPLAPLSLVARPQQEAGTRAQQPVSTQG